MQTHREVEVAFLERIDGCSSLRHKQLALLPFPRKKCTIKPTD
jgi:hypothetical protein